MLTDFISGFRYFLSGVRLISRPRLRRFVIIPVLINTLVFTAAIWLGIVQFNSLLGWVLPVDSGWFAEVARAVLWVVFSFLVLLILFFVFSVFANLIGSPFNGMLSEKVEMLLSGTLQDGGHSSGAMFREVLSSLAGEMRKLRYFLVISATIFLFSLIPLVNAAAPFLWAFFTAWMLSLEYIAYPMENHGMYFSHARKASESHRFLLLGFGTAVLLGTLVPVVNFLVMPAAVAGATEMWVERMKTVGQV